MPINPNSDQLIISSLEKGAKPLELKSFLTSEQGWSQEDADSKVDHAIRSRLHKSLGKGAPRDELISHVSNTKGYDKAYLEQLLAPTDVEQPITDTAEQPIMDTEEAPGVFETITEQAVAKTQDDSDQGRQTVPDIVAKVRNIHQKYGSHYTQLKAAMGVEGAREEALKDSTELGQAIVNNLNQHGFSAQVNPDNGDVLVEDANGNLVEVDSTIWDDIVASRGEALAGVTGGIAGALIGGRAGGPIASFAAGAIGGAGGAVWGRYEDITRNAMETKEQIDSDLIWEQLKDAGAADAIFSVAGTTVFKAGALAAKGAMRAWDLLVSGNKQGAYNSLKEMSHLDDAQVDEVIKDWEDLTGETAAGLTRATKALDVVPRVVKGGEAFVAPAAGLNPLVSTTLSKEIGERADQVLKLADTSDAPDISQVLRDELVEYKNTVKRFYGDTKNQAIAAADGVNYQFDYSQLGIDGVLARAEKNLTKSALREQVLNYADRIRSIGVAEGAGETEGTIVDGFDSLIDLRKTINEFSRSRLVKSDKDIALLSGIKKKIDSEINSVVRMTMDDPDTWINNWEKANTEYGKMFDVEKNVLYKAIMRNGGADKDVVRQLAAKAAATDNTFRQVIEKLPPAIRARTEDSVMDALVNKYAAGEEGAFRAVNFPMLEKQLETIPFTTKKAKDLKRTISQMAKVFQNDVNLARSTGIVQVPKFQSYLTADPIVRAKYEIASSVFNYIRRLSPGKRGESVALVMKLSDMLDKPRSAKAMKTLMASLPDDPAMKESLKRAQLEIAKFGERSEFPKVTIHRSAAPGKAMTSTSGQLGKGLYYRPSKGPVREGLKTTSMNVLPDRIANRENIASALGVDEVTPQMIRETPDIQQRLKDKGYLGLTLDDMILIFN